MEEQNFDTNNEETVGGSEEMEATEPTQPEMDMGIEQESVVEEEGEKGIMGFIKGIFQ